MTLPHHFHIQIPIFIQAMAHHTGLADVAFLANDLPNSTLYTADHTASGDLHQKYVKPHSKSRVRHYCWQFTLIDDQRSTQLSFGQCSRVVYTCSRSPWTFSQPSIERKRCHSKIPSTCCKLQMIITNLSCIRIV